MKKTKLKFAAAVAALAMTFALFTGCNPGEDATSADDGTSTVVDEGEKKTGDGDQATDEKGVTTDETSGTAKDYTVIVNETSKTYTASSAGQIALYGSETGIDVSAGDWLIVKGTVEYKNIGQTYVQLGITGTDGTSTYPSLSGSYITSTGTNTFTNDVIYRITSAGKLTFIAINAFVAPASKNQSAYTGDISVTDLKIVHIAKDKLDTVTTKVYTSASETLTFADNSSEANGTKKIELAPTVSDFSAKKDYYIVALYDRPAIAKGYINHYVNSGIKISEWGGYNAIYPSESAQTIDCHFTVLEDGKSNWLQIGIDGKYSEKEGENVITKYVWDSDPAITITNIEVRILPALSDFE